MSKTGNLIFGFIVLVMFAFAAQIMSGIFTPIISMFGPESQFLITLIIPFIFFLIICVIIAGIE